jgi:hypothetical protein
VASGPYINLLDAFARSAASGATFDSANNIAAAGDALVPINNGASRAPTWHERYAQNLALQQKADAFAQTQHPMAWQIGQLGGMLGNPVYKYLPSTADALGVSSNMPPLLTGQLTGKMPDKPKDGPFGPHGFLSWFGGY